MEREGVSRPSLGAWAAHHVIPHQLWDHPFVQRAVAAGWDLDEAYNGLYLPWRDQEWLGKRWQLPVHDSSHANYTSYVGSHLDVLESQARVWNAANPGFQLHSNQVAFEKLVQLSGRLQLELSYNLRGTGIRYLR